MGEGPTKPQESSENKSRKRCLVTIPGTGLLLAEPGAVGSAAPQDLCERQWGHCLPKEGRPRSTATSVPPAPQAAHTCPQHGGARRGAAKAVTSGHQGLPRAGGWREDLEKTKGERGRAAAWGVLGSAVVRPFQTLVLGTPDTASSESQHSGGPGPIRCRGGYEKSSSGSGQALLPARGCPEADGMGALSWVRSAFMRDEPPEGLGWESSRQRAA